MVLHRSTNRIGCAPVKNCWGALAWQDARSEARDKKLAHPELVGRSYTVGSKAGRSTRASDFKQFGLLALPAAR
jgi:hypothetical protein